MKCANDRISPLSFICVVYVKFLWDSLCIIIGFASEEGVDAVASDGGPVFEATEEAV